jgi:hypothetical protein
VNGPARLRTVILSSALSSATVEVVLVKGALVSVQLNDPASLLQKSAAPGTGLLMGVGSDTHFFRTARLVSQAPGGRTYELLIPFDRSVNLSVVSPSFQLKDASGKLLPNSGTLIPVLAPSSEQPPTVVLTVAGLVAP